MASNLLSSAYEVEVVVDAVSSRTLQNKEIGLQKVKDAGGRWTSVVAGAGFEPATSGL